MPAAPRILYLPHDNVWVVLAHQQPDPAERPTLDDDGLLRYGGRWVAIPDTQLGIATLLVHNVGRLVHNADVRRAYQASGGTGTDASLRSAVHRLRHRIGQLDLLLRVVRDRGLVLDPCGALATGA
jgi:DNA-binding response OmpR family regulator